MYSTSWFASELCSTMKAFKAGQTLEPRLSLRFTLVAEILWCRRSQLQQACTGSSISFSRSLIIRACLMNNCASKLRGTERVLHHQQVADNWSPASCGDPELVVFQQGTNGKCFLPQGAYWLSAKKPSFTEVSSCSDSCLELGTHTASKLYDYLCSTAQFPCHNQVM